MTTILSWIWATSSLGRPTTTVQDSRLSSNPTIKKAAVEGHAQVPLLIILSSGERIILQVVFTLIPNYQQ